VFSPSLLTFNYLPLNNSREPAVLFNPLMPLEQVREKPVSHSTPSYSPFHAADAFCSPLPSEAITCARKVGTKLADRRLFSSDLPLSQHAEEPGWGSTAAPAAGHGAGFVRWYPDCPVISPGHSYRQRQVLKNPQGSILNAGRDPSPGFSTSLGAGCSGV